MTNAAFASRSKLTGRKHKLRTKTVILFGGSFNPPHIGHFETAKHLQDILHADETWFLFSMNWQKNPANYAPLADRIRMGRIMAG
ncbi:MAG TPA: hypothetical protein VIN59_07570, partial [Alphaproteobacteria bacterium]